MSFDISASGHYPPIRLDVLLMAYLVWKALNWLTGRDTGEPGVAIPTALTAVFVLAPYQVSWFVNPSAMIWLGLVGEVSPWLAVALVWTISFGTMKVMEIAAERAQLIELGIGASQPSV